MSLLAVRGEKDEMCVGFKGPERRTTKLALGRPLGEEGRACTQGTVPILAPCSPIHVHPTLVPKHFRVGEGTRSSPTLSCPLREAVHASPEVSDGGVGMQVRATGEARGKQREETAVAGRAAKRSSGLAVSPRSSVLQGPHRLRPTRVCAPCDLLPLGTQQGRCGSEDALSPVLPSPWLLEGQVAVAWVLLELDLLQGEDGGSVFKLVHALSQRPEVGVTQGSLC